MPVHRRRRSRFVCSLLAICSLAVATSYAVSGAGFTTVNEAVDGPDHCQNGNPQVNCNIYDGKQFVWLNGGPAANGLGPDGQYFFAVLEPGGQPSPNDGGSKNLSDDFDFYTDRTFTVTGGEVSAYAGTTHESDVPLIRLFPYADTTNPGGVYIMAICSLARGYPVNPRDCKYDAFKVKEAEVARVQAHLSGMKYEDRNRNGKFDNPGEPGLPEWAIVISCEGLGSDGDRDRLYGWKRHVGIRHATPCPNRRHDDLHRKRGPAARERLVTDRQHRGSIHLLCGSVGRADAGGPRNIPSRSRTTQYQQLAVFTSATVSSHLAATREKGTVTFLQFAKKGDCPHYSAKLGRRRRLRGPFVLLKPGHQIELL